MNYYLIAAVLAATGYLALRRLSRAPPPTSYPEVSDPDFVSNNSTMREIRGRKLRVFELKRNEKGPWLVFIHGLGGTLSQFSDQLENFKEFNILAFDYVGHGKSEVLEDFAAYTTNSLLNDLLALLEPLRGPIVLIAHSYGTSLAILACNALPRAPVGLVLLGVGNPNIPKSAFEKINSLAKRTPEFLIETWRNLFERPGGLESPSVKRFLGPHATEEMKRRQWAWNEGSKTPVLKRMMAGVDFSAVAGVIAGISVPVLLLSGELDQVTPSKNADAVAAILSSANCGKVEKRVVEGASHNMMVDSAELVNQVVGEFVKGVL